MFGDAPCLGARAIWSDQLDQPDPVEGRMIRHPLRRRHCRTVLLLRRPFEHESGWRVQIAPPSGSFVVEPDGLGSPGARQEVGDQRSNHGLWTTLGVPFGREALSGCCLPSVPYPLDVAPPYPPQPSPPVPTILHCGRGITSGSKSLPAISTEAILWPFDLRPPPTHHKASISWSCGSWDYREKASRQIG